MGLIRFRLFFSHLRRILSLMQIKKKRLHETDLSEMEKGHAPG
ncbi:hypothetical protein RLEG12_00575 (plasmid) [Rhizobium leguminosarum bv. trifolii CB782]|nr:hypothetical protein RLEG12_00575 [Rhizobium leguminosarum bv. trifolii CB782]